MDESKKVGSLPLPSSKKGLRGFFRDVKLEMKHVTWPTPKEGGRLTWIVLGVCALVTIMLTVFSYAIEILIKLLITGGK
ncbi:MAG: preprotein translocase subunit SecE [Fimbriimonadaceae bacterium]|nr:preprotein translocase subunit SecE [Fimbriimonadaceae bacterium]